MFSDSSMTYSQERRRRRWSMESPRGLQGYASYLGDASADLSAIVGADVAEVESSDGGAPVWKAICIGVATGAITFLVNHWLAKVLK